MLSASQQKFWNSEIGMERRKLISIEKKKLYEIKNPIINIDCKQCGESFNKRMNSLKEFCSGNCKRKWSYLNIEHYGKHHNSNSYRNQLKTYIGRILEYYEISYDEYLTNNIEITSNAKKDNVIPLHKGISLKTIQKYNIGL